ncbi:nucleoside diphosphate kinase 6 [Ctenocephalides felis]|uniref:nucleoside diphosphate kinase 6 n=1 Tax=Ctenocephalides felis TaxID=7515 RepID=UPI000E6E374E|nr:nucleoside diphosphate kinase 6 [Ctenocephalides felis]
MQKLQLTLAIIKPYILKQPFILEHVRNIILENDFKIILSKRVVLSQQMAENFYREHKEKFFYNRLVTFMTSGASDVYILARHDAIEYWRKLMGPTKVFRAQYSHPDSIRGKFGLSDTRNVSHGSDSPEKAREEIETFFPDFSVDKWMCEEEVSFRNNKIHFIKEDFKHIPLLEKVCLRS